MRAPARLTLCIALAGALHGLLFVSGSNVSRPRHTLDTGKASVAVQFSPPAVARKPTVTEQAPADTPKVPEGPGDTVASKEERKAEKPPVPEEKQSTLANAASPPTPASREQTAARQAPDEPAPVRNPAPPYPGEALKWGIEGRVVARLKVTPSGEVERVYIKKSSMYMSLDDVVVTTLSEWHFKPMADWSGPRWLEQEIEFDLEEQGSRVAAGKLRAASGE